MTNQNNEKSKNGKRLALILIAILLLVAIAFGAYTYSRYVTQDSGTGEATVAKWGYTVRIGQAENSNTDNQFGFSQYYDRVDSTDSSAPSQDADGAVVAAVTSNGDIVAPSSTGSFEFEVTGYGEVAAELTASISAEQNQLIGLVLTNRADTNQTYLYQPITYTLKNDGEIVGNIANLSFDDFKEQLEAQQPLERYAPGNNKGEGANAYSTFTVEWQWLFTHGAVTVADEVTVDGDILDTILGNAAANILTQNEYYDAASGCCIVPASDRSEWVVSDIVTTHNFTFTAKIAQTMELPD